MDNNYTLEQKKALALARARQRQAANQEPERTPAPAFVSRGVASTLGMPMDVLNAGLNKIGVTPDEFEPWLGRVGIEKGLNAISMAATGKRMTPLPDEEAQTLGANMFQGLGEVVGAGGMLGGVAHTVAKGTGKAAEISRNILQGVAARPKTTGALEGISGLGAGGGIYAAQQLAPDTGTAGEVAGAVTGGIAAPGAAMLGAKYMPITLAYRGGKAALAPFTEAGGRVRAGKRLQGLSEDADGALSALQQDNLGGLSPAQMTGEESLLGLEAKIADVDPVLGARRRDQIAESRGRLSNMLATEGRPSAAREVIEGRKEQVLQAVKSRRDEAVSSARQRMDQLTPEQRGSQASMVVREELKSALASARAQENELWNAIPGAGVTTGRLKRKFFDITAKIPIAQRDQIPTVARDLLGHNGKFPKAVNMAELQGLRSQLLEDSRLARAAGQYNKARISDMIADEVLEEMGAASGNIKGPVGQAMREALDFSRSVNETFRQGAVGRVLSPDRLGADKIAPEMTLEAIIGAGRVRGDVGLQSILGAADTPQTRQAVSDYVLGRLNNAAVRNGELNPNAAEKFVRDNVDLLDRFPEMREAVTGAIRSQRDVMRVDGRLKELEGSLSQQKKSATARYLGAQIDEEIPAIMRAQDPVKTAREVKALVRRDPEAVEGLQASAMEYLVNSSKSGFDDFGNEIISGNKIFKTLQDKKQRAVLTEFLGNDGISRVERIALELTKLEKAESANAINLIVSDAPNMLISMIGTTAGARFGAKLGKGTSGASLKTASFMSNQADQILRKFTGDKAEQLLIRAVHDKDLFQALMTETRTVKGQQQAAQRIQAWLVGTGLRLIEDEALNQPVNNGINNKQEVR